MAQTTQAIFKAEIRRLKKAATLSQTIGRSATKPLTLREMLIRRRTLKPKQAPGRRGAQHSG